jgi:hypothetical protein
MMPKIVSCPFRATVDAYQAGVFDAAELAREMGHADAKGRMMIYRRLVGPSPAIPPEESWRMYEAARRIEQRKRDATRTKTSRSPRRSAIEGRA